MFASHGSFSTAALSTPLLLCRYYRLAYTSTALPRAQLNTMSFSNTSVGDKPADPYKKANLDDASVKTKVEGLDSFIKGCKFGMMTTREASSSHLVSRCMALAATETAGVDLLFHTNTESGKTDDLTSDPNVNVAFINSTGEWASISGEATIATDRELVKKHYHPALKAWLGDLGDGKHDGSENDPRIGIIRVKMLTATYSLATGTLMGRVSEVVQGAVTGKPAQANRLREISASEVLQWRTISK